MSVNKRPMSNQGDGEMAQKNQSVPEPLAWGVGKTGLTMLKIPRHVADVNILRVFKLETLVI